MPNDGLPVDLLFNMAVQYHDDGDFPRAEIHYKKVLAADPDHLGANHRLGLLAARFRNFKAALGFFQKALSIDPNSAENHYYLGSIYWELREFDYAIVCLEKALQIQPDYAAAKRTLANIRKDSKIAKDCDYAPADSVPWKDSDSIWEEYGGNSTLFVVFSGAGINDGIPTFMFQSFLSGYSDIDKLFLRDHARSWYLQGLKGLTTDVDSTRAYLETKIAGYDRTVFLGFSSGATAAILFGELLGADKILAFSPQTVLTDDKENDFDDHRWEVRLANMRPHVHGLHYMDLRNMNPFSESIDIHYGKGMPLDCVHAEQIKGNKVRRVAHDSDSHVVSVELKNSGELEKIIKGAIPAT